MCSIKDTETRLVSGEVSPYEEKLLLRGGCGEEVRSDRTLNSIPFANVDVRLTMSMSKVCLTKW
jgi:hypothetical protein